MLQLDNTNLKSNPGRLQLQTSRGSDLPRLFVVLRCLEVAEQVSQALYVCQQFGRTRRRMSRVHTQEYKHKSLSANM